MTENIVIFKNPETSPVIVEERPDSQAVSISLFVRGGSRHEQPGKAGVAHLLEHLVFRGTKNRTSKEISEQVEDAGGELNGFTDKEYTCYYSSIISETYTVAREILADIVFNPLLEERYFNLEKQIVDQEVNMLFNEPESYIHHLFYRTLWRGHPLSFPEAGDPESIKKIELEDLVEFYNNHYRPQDIILVCSGAVDAEKLNEWAVSELSVSSHPKRNKIQDPPIPCSRIELFPREGNQAYVGMGVPGYNASDPKKHVERILATILGAGMSSRLFQKIREEMGLVYSIYSYCRYLSDCGTMAFFFSTSDRNVGKVMETIASEFRRFKEEGTLPGELKRAKRLIKGVLVRRLESTENRMFRLGEEYLLTGQVKPMEQLLNEIHSVTEEEVIEVANKLLCREKLAAAVHAGLTEKEIEVYESLDF